MTQKIGVLWTFRQIVYCYSYLQAFHLKPLVSSYLTCAEKQLEILSEHLQICCCSTLPIFSCSAWLELLLGTPWLSRLPLGNSKGWRFLRGTTKRFCLSQEFLTRNPRLVRYVSPNQSRIRHLVGLKTYLSHSDCYCSIFTSMLIFFYLYQ